ncbi:cytochrome c family protein [Martelella alba]|uniref:Cytochrome c family protein n=1 Tax=Martelella alba TaxID=2590451 RepID=A0A506UA65_9HYPH|nr:cytochrome c family protein [Martelella alba]TPW30770.1 cytochrome c family protein [Martelella alba]
MNFNLNMVLAALLGTLFVLMSVSFVSEAIFDPRLPEKEGFAIAVPEGMQTPKAKGPAATPLAELLAHANADQGQQIFKRCQACHSIESGGPNKVGPNLYGVVDRPVASHQGFAYSAPMKEFAEGGQKHWTYENLNAFITAPRKDVPGTAMGFAGLSSDKDRADLLAYLQTASDAPVPFPEVQVPADTAAAPAGDAAEAPAKSE